MLLIKRPNFLGSIKCHNIRKMNNDSTHISFSIFKKPSDSDM